MLAYGETLMNRVSTNGPEKLADYGKASQIFESVSERFPTNPVAVLALDQKAAASCNALSSKSRAEPLTHSRRS